MIPVIDIVIILWSLYAFFMVLGLSKDTIGKSAIIFRDASKVFLQYSFMILGVFMVLFGFLIYGFRLIFVLFIVVTTLIIGLYVHLSKRTKRSHERLSLKCIKEYLSGKMMNNRPFILGLIFLSSATIVLYYPDSWFASTIVIFVFFVSAVVSVSLILAYQKEKSDKMTEDYNIRP